MTLSDLGPRLHKARRKVFKNGCEGYSCVCPVCNSNSLHLAIWQGPDEYWHCKCIKECDEDAILGAWGLTQEDRRLEPPGQTPRERECVYSYYGADGSYLFEKVRTIKDGKKAFLQRIQQPGGGYDYQLGALNGQAKTLYRLTEVLGALKKGKVVYVMEGEKAVERARTAGLIATCQPGGATDKRPETKWLKEHTEIFRGASVVIVADRDDVGETYARYVASQLRSVALSVSVVQSATVKEKDDAYDHFEGGYTVDDFIPRPDLIPRRGFATKTVESYESKTPEYLMGRHIRRGQINLLDADGAVGKTTLCLAFAASGSNGYDPIGRCSCEPFRTLYFGTEDEPGELRKVYESVGGKPGFLETCVESFSMDAMNLQLLRETIEDGVYQFVVFDALLYYLHGIVKSTNDALELSPVLKGQRDVAMQTGAAILNVRHTAKGTLGKTPAEFGMGSVQFRNSHRSQMLVRDHPDKDRYPGVRIVTHEKGSLQTERGQSFGFQLRRDTGFGWRYDVGDDAFDEKSVQEAKKGKLVDAENMLRTELLGKYVPAKEIERYAEALGVSERTLDRARANLGVTTTKVSGSGDWVLHLPDPSDPFSDE